MCFTHKTKNAPNTFFNQGLKASPFLVAISTNFTLVFGMESHHSKISVICYRLGFSGKNIFFFTIIIILISSVK